MLSLTCELTLLLKEETNLMRGLDKEGLSQVHADRSPL